MQQFEHVQFVRGMGRQSVADKHVENNGILTGSDLCVCVCVEFFFTSVVLNDLTVSETLYLPFARPR